MADIELEEQPEFNEDNELIEELESDEPDVSSDTPVETSVVVEDDDGEYDNVEVPEGETEKTRMCLGLFAKLAISDFTQNKNYSDTYLKAKGLFKETEEE